MTITEQIRKESKIETAKNMLKLGSSIDFIQEATGLSIEEIKKIEIGINITHLRDGNIS